MREIILQVEMKIEELDKLFEDIQIEEKAKKEIKKRLLEKALEYAKKEYSQISLVNCILAVIIFALIAGILYLKNLLGMSSNVLMDIAIVIAGVIFCIIGCGDIIMARKRVKSIEKCLKELE